MCPASAGGLSTTAPPGKPLELFLKNALCKPFPPLILLNECGASILPIATQEVAESRLEAVSHVYITSGCPAVCFFILVEPGIFKLFPVGLQQSWAASCDVIVNA